MCSLFVEMSVPGWYAKGHIPGAPQVDASDIAVTAAHQPAPDMKVAIYYWSTTCTGSAIVADALAALGHGNVHRYVEGKKDRQAHGHPIAEPAG